MKKASVDQWTTGRSRDVWLCGNNFPGRALLAAPLARGQSRFAQIGVDLGTISTHKRCMVVGRFRFWQAAAATYGAPATEFRPTGTCDEGAAAAA
jgi:hypothetical protein